MSAGSGAVGLIEYQCAYCEKDMGLFLKELGPDELKSKRTIVRFVEDEGGKLEKFLTDNKIVTICHACNKKERIRARVDTRTGKINISQPE